MRIRVIGIGTPRGDDAAEHGVAEACERERALAAAWLAAGSVG